MRFSAAAAARTGADEDDGGDQARPHLLVDEGSHLLVEEGPHLWEAGRGREDEERQGAFDGARASLADLPCLQSRLSPNSYNE